MLEPCCDHVALTLAPYCAHHVVTMLRPCWIHVATMLGPCYGHVATILGLCWDIVSLTRTMLVPCVDYISAMLGNHVRNAKCYLMRRAVVFQTLSLPKCATTWNLKRSNVYPLQAVTPIRALHMFGSLQDDSPIRTFGKDWPM